jgi:hypothetical protein
MVVVAGPRIDPASLILGGLLWWSGYFEGKRDTIVLEKKGTEFLGEEAPGAPGESHVLPADAPGTETAPPVSEVVTEPPSTAPVSAEPARIALAESNYFYTINVASYTDDKWARKPRALRRDRYVSCPGGHLGKARDRLMTGSFG